MKPKISIGTCQRAIGVVERASEIAGGGIPVMIRGEQVVITRAPRVQGKRWVSGDIRFTPKEKELLTNQARVIIAGKDTASQ